MPTVKEQIAKQRRTLKKKLYSEFIVKISTKGVEHIFAAAGGPLKQPGFAVCDHGQWKIARIDPRTANAEWEVVPKDVAQTFMKTTWGQWSHEMNEAAMVIQKAKDKKNEAKQKEAAKKQKAADKLEKKMKEKADTQKLMKIVDTAVKQTVKKVLKKRG